MNFTLELKNIPLSDKVTEIWWQAWWLPQGLLSEWKEVSTLPDRQVRQFYTFSGADPEGRFSIGVWGRVPDPQGVRDYWIKYAEKDSGRMSLKEGETVVVDMAASAASVLRMPLLIVGGLALAALGIVALKRR